METRGFSPTIASYNTLIEGYCNKGLLNSGMNLKNMIEKNGVLLDNVTTLLSMGSVGKGNCMKQIRSLVR